MGKNEFNQAISKRQPGALSTKAAKKAEGIDDTPDFDQPDEAPPEKPQSHNLKPKQFERTFTKVKRIVSDVFKLKSAVVLKQTGAEKDYNKEPESYKPFEHTHVFRTFDSDGKRHDKCGSIAGHFHDIDWAYDENNKPVIKSISGPRVMSSKMVKGKRIPVSIPVNDFDDHVHEIEYLNSNEVDARTTNIEAQKVVAFEAQKGAPPSGAREA